MKTTEKSASQKHLEREIEEREGEIKSVIENIESTRSVGQIILICVSALSAILAGIGMGAIYPDILHQFAMGGIVFTLAMVLGKRATLSVPQMKLWLVLTYSFLMIFISAAWFVLGFVKDKPVRFTMEDDSYVIENKTVKYQSESNKMDQLMMEMHGFVKNLRQQAEDEKNFGALSGVGGEALVYKTYHETADFIDLQRQFLEEHDQSNQEAIEDIRTTLGSFKTVIWDESLGSEELHTQAKETERSLRDYFVTMKRNSKLAESVIFSIEEYADNLNTKRAEKNNRSLKSSQEQVVENLKDKLDRFAKRIDAIHFVDRQENSSTISIRTPDAYVANLIQAPRNIGLWIAGLMLDIAAPLFVYLIIGSFIKKRDELQEDSEELGNQLEALLAAEKE